jgi:hypothetical protein
MVEDISMGLRTSEPLYLDPGRYPPRKATFANDLRNEAWVRKEE